MYRSVCGLLVTLSLSLLLATPGKAQTQENNWIFDNDEFVTTVSSVQASGHGSFADGAGFVAYAASDYPGDYGDAKGSGVYTRTYIWEAGDPENHLVMAYLSAQGSAEATSPSTSSAKSNAGGVSGSVTGAMHPQEYNKVNDQNQATINSNIYTRNGDTYCDFTVNCSAEAHAKGATIVVTSQAAGKILWAEPHI